MKFYATYETNNGTKPMSPYSFASEDEAVREIKRILKGNLSRGESGDWVVWPANEEKARAQWAGTAKEGTIRNCRRIKSTNAVVRNAMNADGIADVNVQFNTIDEKGIATIRYKFKCSEFEDWMRKIGCERQLPNVWFKLMKGESAIVQLPSFDAMVR